MATNERERQPELTARQPSIWQSPAVNLIGRFVALLLVFLLFTVLIKVFKGKDFYSLRNVESLLRQSAVYATAALGMTMVIITAGIDLSVGSTIALALVVVAWILSLSHDVVRFGARVVVADERGDRKTYLLVGPDEADPTQGKISFQSPLGRALMGRSAGDIATVLRPAGETDLEIVSIDYGG